MNNAAQYAQALYVMKNPDAKRVHQALLRRGHAGLMPSIVAEYEKLELAQKRLKKHKTITPSQRQTRVLFELYKKLVS